MGWPDLTWRSRLAPEIRNELEQLVALTQGFLSAEHGADGQHTTITVDGIQFRAADGTILATIGIVNGRITIGYAPRPQPPFPAPPRPEDVIVIAGAAQINDVLVGDHRHISGGSFSVNAGIDLNTDEPTTPAKQWLIASGTDGLTFFGNSGALLLASRAATGSVGEGVVLYFSPLFNGYALCPPAAGSLLTYRLGSRLDSRLIWDEINGKTIYARDGYQERGRTVPVGEWIDVPYNAANFSGDGGMTVTVDAADQLSFKYTLIGRTMLVIFQFAPISLGGVLSNVIRVLIPGGFTAAASAGTLGDGYDNGTYTPIVIGPDGGTIVIARQDRGVWSASVNNTSLGGQLVIALA